jgi:hypothetical protein
MRTLLQVSLRYKAVLIPEAALQAAAPTQQPQVAVLIAQMNQLGYGVSEALWKALCHTEEGFRAELIAQLKQLAGVHKNWTPLVKNWQVPTGEGYADHLMTFFAQLFGTKDCTRLACGHLIPANTFPLERYNGCPYCGTPFELDKTVYLGQGSKLHLLELWTEADAQKALRHLLEAKTALDATQIDSLQQLLAAFALPQDVVVGMKETLMEVIDYCLAQGRGAEVQALFQSPNDILRYLWFRHTGLLQIVAPKTIIKRKAKNKRHIHPRLDQGIVAQIETAQQLRLKYDRKTCRQVAEWLNGLPMSPRQMAETMHPKRQMWVRFIRALRLAEMSQRQGMSHLRELMDVFYRQDYPVWQGRVEQARLRYNQEETLALLQQRPGLFARSLFAQMLWFGANPVLQAFEAVADQVPMRLLLTLQMYAGYYFDPTQQRSVKPLGGVNKTIPPNQMLKLYKAVELKRMTRGIDDLCVAMLYRRFAQAPQLGKTMYIHPMLYKIPLAIGDRSETVQDRPVALMGTRFPIEGTQVRLFMQWGEGLPAQHLDMDLSCHLIGLDKKELCYFGNLTATGCQHSGDIRSIPAKVGTAEYININVNKVAKAGYTHAVFTCNAYSNGEITPNLVLGWMDSRHRMKISEKSGVAYDPSCVQHQVRISQSLSKSLVFGVLEIATREIIWLELPFSGQLAAGLNFEQVQALLARLNSKFNVGRLLEVKAKAQGMLITEEASQAEEQYGQNWVYDPAAVTALFAD